MCLPKYLTHFQHSKLTLPPVNTVKLNVKLKLFMRLSAESITAPLKNVLVYAIIQPFLSVVNTKIPKLRGKARKIIIRITCKPKCIKKQKMTKFSSIILKVSRNSSIMIVDIY